MADNSLALGIRPMAVPDYAGATMNRVNMMGALAKMDEYKAGVAEKNAMAQFMAQPNRDLNNTETQNEAMRLFPNVAPGIFKSLTEARTANVDLRSAELKLKGEQIDTAMKDILRYPTKEAALVGIKKHLDLGDIDQAKADTLIQSINAAPTFEAWQVGTMRGMADYLKQLEQTFTTQNLGGTTRVIATPTLAGGGGAVIVPGSTGTVTMTPGDVQQAKDAAAGRGVTMRGQDLQNAPNVVARIVTAADGTVTQFNKFGNVIGTPQRVGKPSATFERTRGQREQLNKDLTFAISKLEEATKPGGLIETATGSGLGAARDIGAGFFGGATPGSVAIGALKPIYDMVLKMVPRFEGPQSEKDVVSYQDAAGNLANPNTPTATKMAAAKEILRLMKARKGQFLTRDMAEGSGIVENGAAAPLSDDELKTQLGL